MATDSTNAPQMEIDEWKLEDLVNEVYLRLAMMETLGTIMRMVEKGEMQSVWEVCRANYHMPARKIADAINSKREMRGIQI